MSVERASRGAASRIGPRELEHFLGSLPFLGALSASHERLEAGQSVELVLVYRVGSAGLADSGRLKVTYKFYSDWGEPQTHDPRGANYLTARVRLRPTFPGESEATVQRLDVKFDRKGHERPYQKAIIVDVVDGYLRPGDEIEIRLGDRAAGGPGTRAQTFVEDAFKLRAYVDMTGTSRLAAVPGDVRLAVVAGAPEHLQVITPRLVARGETTSILARLDDAWGNPCPNPGGRAMFVLRRAGSEDAVARQEVSWTADERSACATFTVDEAGDYRVDVQVAGAASVWNAVAPIAIAMALPARAPRAYFADLHVHAHDTVGTNSTSANLRFARDLARLDILGYTVNDFQITDGDWTSALADLRAFHQDGRFVCFPGTEWCGNSAAGGDHNVVFLDDEDVRFPRDAAGGPLRSFEWHEHMRAGAAPVPGRWPLSRLYDEYEDAPERFLMIPHVGGRRAILDWHHPDLERLVEIASSWGHFDWLYRDALARGYRVGASASGDEHRGRPGGGAPGASIFGVRGGLTGVLAPALTRRDVAEALRSRHTWATTGERNVALLSCGEHVQGDELDASGDSVTLRYQLLGERGWEWIAIQDQAGVLWHRDLHSELGFASDRLRIRWGGARVKDRYRWAVWKIDVAVEGSRVAGWSARGLEHPEERVRDRGSGRFEIESATHGDADELEIALDAPERASVAIRATIGSFDGRTSAPIDWQVSHHDLLQAGALRRDLDGVDLFLAVERVTARALPLTLSGDVRVSLPPGGPDARALYLFARELGDAKVWTSPLFVRRSP